jgi:hypothetical protein
MIDVNTQGFSVTHIIKLKLKVNWSTPTLLSLGRCVTLVSKVGLRISPVNYASAYRLVVGLNHETQEG